MEQEQELRALTVKIPEATYKVLRKLSIDWGMTNAGVVIQAIANLERLGPSAFDAPSATADHGAKVTP